MAQLPRYTLPDGDLEAGASLGNSALWVTCLATGAVEQVYCCAAGRAVVGSVALRYGLRPRAAAPARHAAPAPCTPLVPPPGTMTLHAAYQQHVFDLLPQLTCTETVLLPLRGAEQPGDDPPLLYVLTTLHNRSLEPLRLRVAAVARLCGLVSRPVCPRYDAGALVAHDRDDPHVARAVGCSDPTACWATTSDFGLPGDPRHLPQADGRLREGDVLGLLTVDLDLPPGAVHPLSFVVAVSAQGADDALAHYQSRAAPSAALAQTEAHLGALLARSVVLTPDPVVSAGVAWSKINMRRVMARYPQGPAFTNDPGHSSAVVGRDAAWFVLGCDYLDPAFARALLDGLARAQEPGGKIPEYYDALSGRAEDDGLNINDDTPLWLLACAHHYHATGDRAWLAARYPALAAAAAWITQQRDERGLVSCTARDPRGNVWASAGWRNIIPQYSLNGAVTELNAECYAALRAAASLAAALGEDAAAAEQDAAAQALRGAMERHLLNRETGLYHLHIDLDGTAHSDVTADLLFPVLFGVCSAAAAARILDRLAQPDFWTPAGLRTVPRHDPLYDPSGNVGLLGGVWPGVTWWLAMACARTHPALMGQALRASFAHYAADPRLYNTVPGQFSEWVDGESLVNRGMRLSPWEPPRFLWAAVEGVCGFQPQDGPPRVHPVLPPAWSWVALRHVPVGDGGLLSYVAVRGGRRLQVYASALVQSDLPTEVYAEDVTDALPLPLPDVAVLALRRPGPRDGGAGDLLVFVGSSADARRVVPLDLGGLLHAERAYRVRVEAPDAHSWQTASGAQLASQVIELAPGGYGLLLLQEKG